MEKETKKEIHLALKIIGTVSVLVGILGLLLPVLPGIPFLIIGFILLGEKSIITKRVIRKLPKPARDKIEKTLENRKNKK